MCVVVVVVSSCILSETLLILRRIQRDIVITFYVLLTVHLSITLKNDQLDTHLLYFILQYVYYNPLHV